MSKPKKTPKCQPGSDRTQKYRKPDSATSKLVLTVKMILTLIKPNWAKNEDET